MTATTRPRVRRLRRQAVRRPMRTLEPCQPTEWRITERRVVLRELWAEPEDWPMWQEWSAAGAIVVAFVVGLAGGAW